MSVAAQPALAASSRPPWESGSLRDGCPRTASLIEKTALEEGPRGAVVQVEETVGTEVLAREELAVRAGNEPHELLVGQFLELLGRDRLADPESLLLHLACLLPVHQEDCAELSLVRAAVSCWRQRLR